jgi:hypothetical protein
MFVALGSPLFHFILFMGSSSKEHIHRAMPTYVRLVDTKRLGIPRIVPSFHRGERKEIVIVP